VPCADGQRKPHLIVPYTLDANDMRFATAQGFNTAEQFYTYLAHAAARNRENVAERESVQGGPATGSACR
jgi:hypothetical protein